MRAEDPKVIKAERTKVIRIQFFILLCILVTFCAVLWEGPGFYVDKGDTFVQLRDPHLDAANPYINEVKVTYVFRILGRTDDYCLYEQEKLAFRGKTDKDTLSSKCELFKDIAKVAPENLYKIRLRY